MNAATELESFGISGPSKIRQILSKTRKTTTLINAVKKFREENSIQIDSLATAANLLDLHSIKRKDFHETAVNDLTEKLLQRIRTLGEDASGQNEFSAKALTKLEEQLDKCFRLYNVPHFRPIVLETLKQLPKVPESYLTTIVNDKALYLDCAITVRQQIWLNNHKLFIEALQPVVNSYRAKKRDIEFTIDQSNTNFFTFETTKARRQWKQVQDLVTMVGVHEDLYVVLTKFIRDLYLETGDSHLCSLRSEVVMAAHDLNMDSIVKTDPCHDFIWFLDACVRDKHLDPQQTNKLKAVLDNSKKTNMEMIQDLAMVAADVHASHFLLSMVVKRLRDATGAHIPRDLPSVQLALRIVSLGSRAYEIVTTDSVPSDVVDSILFTKFLPILESCMIEDNMRLELIRNKVDHLDDVTMASCLTPLPEIVTTFLKGSSVASLLFLHYVMDLLPSKRRVGDLRGLARYMGVIGMLRGQLASKGVWCHLFIHRLIYSNQFEIALGDQALYEPIMEGILFKHIQSDEVVKFQILRIINLIGFVWGVPPCQEMLAKISSEIFSHLEASQLARYRNEYQRVVDKLNPPVRPIEDVAPLHIMSPRMGMSGMGSPPPVRQYSAMIGTPRMSF